MAKYNLNFQDDSLDEIVLNEYGDSIFISGDDANLWNRFCDGYQAIKELVQKTDEKLEELENKHKDSGEDNSFNESADVIRTRTDFCEKVTRLIDDIFGEGTTKKSFRENYESIPGFIPDERKFSLFFDVMTPIIEDIFNRKMERDKKESKARMAKYQPQDHKKPQKNGASK